MVARVLGENLLSCMGVKAQGSNLTSSRVESGPQMARNMLLSNQQQQGPSRLLPTCCPEFARGMAPQQKALPPGPARIPAGLLSCCPCMSVGPTTGCEQGAIKFTLLLEAAAKLGPDGMQQGL